MRTRAISSIGVIVVGLVPALVGGPVFALLMAAIAVVGWREFRRIGGQLPGGPRIPETGIPVVLALTLAGLLGWGLPAVAAIVALAIAAPLVAQFRSPNEPGAITGWALAVAGSLYLGVPALAATSLRGLPGEVGADWMNGLAGSISLGWPAAARGMAWVLTVILVTWIADSAAYLVGRSMGRRKLAPALSPNKTVEGALGGLAGAALVAMACFALFGLPGGLAAAAGTGVALGVAGQVGDLSESLMKRQAGVKDSGNLIPGHGGILDRVDALLFALPAGWMIALAVETLAR